MRLFILVVVCLLYINPAFAEFIFGDGAPESDNGDNVVSEKSIAITFQGTIGLMVARATK